MSDTREVMASGLGFDLERDTAEPADIEYVLRCTLAGCPWWRSMGANDLVRVLSMAQGHIDDHEEF